MTSSYPIVAVAGLPRSGTSLAMHMLRAGGLQVLADDPNAPDGESGLETTLIRRLPEDSGWLEEARGKAVKILDPHRYTPPEGLPYRFLWMQRKVKEQAKSQRRMLQATGQQVPRGKLAQFRALIKRDTRRCRFLREYENARIHVVHFERLLQQPAMMAQRIARHVAGGTSIQLDVDAMVAQVRDGGDQSLKEARRMRRAFSPR